MFLVDLILAFILGGAVTQEGGIVVEGDEPRPRVQHDGTIHTPDRTPGGGCIDGAPC
jgi:hypothetical protein